MFCEKGVLRKFAKFTGKHLCQSLFFDKVAGGACNFIKKETLAQVFSCEFCKISRNSFFFRTSLVAASDPRKAADNRTFWRPVKPFLSNKSVENEKIILVEKEEILTKDNSVAKVLNKLFSNIVKALGISDYMDSHPLAKEVDNPTLRAIMK